MSHLFTPLTLRDVTFAHRAWMSPMMQFAAVSQGPTKARRRIGICSTWGRGRLQAPHW